MTSYTTCLLVVTLSVLALPVSGQHGQTPWTPWSFCTASCGGGNQERFRDCYDSNLCSLGRLTENRNCGNIPCPVDGGWELWESWRSCTVTCGGGLSSRERSCDAPVPDFGGKFCVGGNPANIDIENVEWEWKVCNTNPCVVDGMWSVWGEWANCSQPCNTGMTERKRTCTSPAPAWGGLPCDGIPTESRRCNVHIPCPVDGAWVQWSRWNFCSSTCAGGIQLKTRTCTNPFPLYNGKPCIGETQMNRTCNDHIPCPVNGEWQAWTPWGLCTSSCTGGTSTRTRVCSKAMYGGYVCLTGKGSESVPCNQWVTCSVDGNWAMWDQWTGCTSTCAGGTRTRFRACSNPTPRNGGLNCIGNASETGHCNAEIGCPVNGQWTVWALWSPCTSPCGGGQTTRTRACTAPPPLHGGSFCAGSEVETISCNLDVPC